MKCDFFVQVDMMEEDNAKFSKAVLTCYKQKLTYALQTDIRSVIQKCLVGRRRRITMAEV